MKKTTVLDLSPAKLRGFLNGLGEPSYRAKQVLSWIYQKGATSFAQMTDLPRGLRDKLEDGAQVGFPDEVARQVSADGTVKFLLRLSDGQGVETVALPYEKGYSACISTQVGCKMGCLFCASGLPGFVRNLAPPEMMAQVLHIKNWCRDRGADLKSIVLMGTGEPLDNLDAVISFLEAVRDRERLGMSLRHVTISTSGLVPGILALAELGWPVTLAVSLHAPFDMLRNRLVPVNRKYPIATLLAACDGYAKKTGRRVTYEYVLLKNVNDGEEQARELARLLCGRLCHVNLIAMNIIPGLELEPSPEPVVRKFRNTLLKYRINVTVRRRLGTDIAAACGQLRNSFPGQCD